MEKSNFIKYWRWFIYIICGLIMILPISESVNDLTEDLRRMWSNNYVINTIEYAILVIPLISFLLLIPRMEKPIKRILIAFSLMLSGFISYASILSFILLAQDFAPHYGMLLSLFFFPLVIINSIIEWKQGLESQLE